MEANITELENEYKLETSTGINFRLNKEFTRLVIEDDDPTRLLSFGVREPDDKTLPKEVVILVNGMEVKVL